MLAQLSEWQKILITALSAFTLGILAEPVKLAISDGYKKRKLRKLLYKRVYVIYSALSHTIKLLKEKPDEVAWRGKTGKEYATMLVPNIDIGILKYAMEKEGASFYQLDIARTVSGIVRNLEDVDEQTPMEEIRRVAELIINIVDSNVSWGQISGKALTHIAVGEDWNSSERISELDPHYDPLTVGYKDKSFRQGVRYGSLYPLIARLDLWIRHHRRLAK